MTKTESAEKLIKTLVIESCEQLLDFHGAEGVRAAIPNTNNLIMVGTPEWIAKNVPGVEAMVAGALPDAMQNIAAMVWEQALSDAAFYVAGHCANGEHHVDDIMSMRMPKISFAATTQASTAQAERVPIELADVQAQLDEESGFWHTCSGCHESEDGHDNGHYPYSTILRCKLGMGCRECGGIGAVWDNTDYDAMAADMFAATSSTDAQAAAEVRDALHLAEDALTSCLRGGYTDVDGDYVRTFSFDADKVDAALRALRAGDTGEQADGGAA